MDRRRFLRGMMAGAAAIAAAPLAAKLPAVQETVAATVKTPKPIPGARTEFKDGCWTVYDHNGIARVTFGVF
ncbi:periplasmic nitrate reductase [Stenotrophomonas phage Siara]|uniref:Periplasmic nitrate reductase n=1 Tax=Stenotrophomonas phage Siara TaxID=2859658 RepID=A0AAE7WMA4_9CAUD|nr:periplasmic nitrate reductase [Stenotrophomonas phage Siara]QYW02088.1 periplasmic nitrate reductase [Stenotrophomonas phage Siara]